MKGSKRKLVTAGNSLQILLFSLLAITSSHAETPADIAKNAHLSNINALLIFTSQEGLSSGHYRFTNVGVDMDIYHLPFNYQLPSKENGINYFVVGNVGYSRTFLSEDIDVPPNGRLDYDNHLRTYTAGIGGGIRYEAEKNIYFSSGFELIYSRSGASVRLPDDDIGDAIEDFFKQNYNDNISYKLFADMLYQPIGYTYKPYVKLSFKLYETKSTFDFDDLASFQSHSNITTLTLGAETPRLLNSNGNYLTFEGYINGNYLTGQVKDSTKIDTYGTLGTVAYWYTPGYPAWADRFFLEVSTVGASGLEGYNIGIGFTLNFGANSDHNAN